jgi:hypothetical protein
MADDADQYSPALPGDRQLALPRMALDDAGPAPQHDTNAPYDSLGRSLSPQAERAHALQHHSYSTAIGPQTP